MKIHVNEKDLEKSLKDSNVVSKEPNITPEEEIGFHKGCLNTLLGERNELVKMIQNVELIMQAHIKRLEELGVKINIEKR